MALKSLKQRMGSIDQVVTLPMGQQPIQLDPYTQLWADCKAKRALHNSLEEMEQRIRKEHEDDSDTEGCYIFSAENCIRHAIICAVSFEKEMQKLKTRVTEIESKHEQEIFKLRSELNATKHKCDTIHANYMELSTIHSELLNEYNVLSQKE